HGNPNPSKLPLPMTYVDHTPVLEPESILDHRIIKRNGAVDDLEDKVIAIKGGIDTGPMDSKPHRPTRLTRRPARYED
ncbi:hypothetical protein Tco_0398631, partial [Tanacetum coccineum]